MFNKPVEFYNINDILSKINEFFVIDRCKPVKIRSIVKHPVTMGDGIATLKPETVMELPEKAAVYFMARKWAHLVLES